jgi:hypothetical protein
MRARDLESGASSSSSTTAKHNANSSHPNDAHEDRNARRPTIRMIVVRCAKNANVKSAVCLCLVLSWFLVARPGFLNRDAQRKRKWLQFVKSTHVREATQNRHQCIAAIRKKHNEALLDLVQKEDGGLSAQVEPKSILLVDPAYHSNVGEYDRSEQTLLGYD